MRWLALALLAGCATSPVPADRFEALDRELAAIVDDRAKPLASLSVLAIRDGQVAYERHFGRRHIDPDKPADGATLYRLASITKLATTIGVLRLVEDGKLSLDTDVGAYLGYRLRNPHFPDVPVTLRMLLAHTSSIRDDGGYFWDARHRLRDVLPAAMWSNKAPPGKYFSYANLPWGIAGEVMERATGERFDRLMRRLVLDPLGLQGGFNPAEIAPERIAHIATLYRKGTSVGDREVWNPQGPWIAQVDDYSVQAPVSRARDGYEIGSNGTLFAPQGGLRASAADLGRVMRMLMNRGELDGSRILKPESVDLMLSRQWRYDGANGDSGYGARQRRFNAWGLGNQQFLDVSGPGSGDRLVEGGGFRAVGHLGDAYGLYGTFAFDPATRNGIVFLAGGTGFDPAADPGAYSAFSRFEERIQTALYRAIK